MALDRRLTGRKVFSDSFLREERGEWREVAGLMGVAPQPGGGKSGSWRVLHDPFPSTLPHLRITYTKQVGSSFCH